MSSEVPNLSPKALNKMADDISFAAPQAAAVLREVARRGGLVPPPPAGALHPLAAALLDATEALVKDSGYRNQALCDAESVAYRAWSAADFPRYTAAPPALSARDQYAAMEAEVDAIHDRMDPLWWAMSAEERVSFNRRAPPTLSAEEKLIALTDAVADGSDLTDEEVDADLRSMGYDPAKVRARGEAVVKKLLGETLTSGVATTPALGTSNAARAPVTPTLCGATDNCGPRGELVAVCDLPKGHEQRHEGPDPIAPGTAARRTWWDDWSKPAPVTPTPEPVEAGVRCGFGDGAHDFGPCALWRHHVGNHKDAQGRRWKGWVEPEPATVEPRDHYCIDCESMVPDAVWVEHVRTMCFHKLKAPPASPPASPPAVTRDPFADLVARRFREIHNAQGAPPWSENERVNARIDSLISTLEDVLDEDEARRDADRRGTK